MSDHSPHRSVYQPFEIWFCNTHTHCHSVPLGQPVIFWLINSPIWPKQYSESCNVLTASVVLISLCVCVCVGQTAQLFVSKSLGIWGTRVDKSRNVTLRVKKKKMPAFYAGQKSRRSQIETHERLRGNLGTKQQLDNTPYAPWPIIHHFSLACTRVHPMDFQGST